MLARLRKYFLSGLVIFLPLALTMYLFLWTIVFFDGVLGRFIEPYFERQFGFYFRGLSIIVGVLLVLLIGFLATNFFGRKIHAHIEKLFVRLPFFKQVYPAVKEIALFVFSRDKLKFQQVVLVEYPRKGIYSFGFLTNESARRLKDLVGRDLCNVFFPSTPSPLTGYMALVPREDVVPCDLPVEEVLKLVVSGGVVNPFGG